MFIKRNKIGFTLVELMIVIVVIAILASIITVSYRGVISRAHDAQRMSDLSNMKDMLEMYRTKHGHFPYTDPNPGYVTSLGRHWESSIDPGFLSDLDVYTGGARFAPPGVQKKLVNEYAYLRFAPGAFGCDVKDGPFIVLRITGMEAQKEPWVLKTGPCTGNGQGAIKGDYSVWMFEN